MRVSLPGENSALGSHLGSHREILPAALTIRPSTMPKLSWMTLAKGAKQLVVQEALLKGKQKTRSWLGTHPAC